MTQPSVHDDGCAVSGEVGPAGHQSGMEATLGNGPTEPIPHFDVEALPDNVMFAHSVRIRDALENRAEQFIR